MNTLTFSYCIIEHIQIQLYKERERDTKERKCMSLIVRVNEIEEEEKYEPEEKINEKKKKNMKKDKVEEERQDK